MLELTKNERAVSSDGWQAWIENKNTFIYEDAANLVQFEREIGSPSAVYFATAKTFPKVEPHVSISDGVLRDRVVSALRLIQPGAVVE